MHAARCQAHRPASWDAAVARRAAAQAGAADTAEPAVRGARRCHDETGDEGGRHMQRAEARHPLVAAMSEALRSLLPAGGTAQGGQEPGVEAQDSARAFAHELVDALRGQVGHRHGRHHRHHGYDDLAQRLERLAGSLEQPAGASAGAAATTSTTTLSASLVTTSLNLSIDTNGGSASLTLSSLTLDVSQQSTGTAAATPADESPLLAAFRRLMTALQPDTAPAQAAGEGRSLPAFLRQLAGALRGSGAPAEAAPRGGLVSLAA